MDTNTRVRQSPILQVCDLRTYFRTADGIAKAVDGVSFDVMPGESVGIVGESGSGKSVTALSIMRLIQPPGWIADGQILFNGKDLAQAPAKEMRAIRGGDMTMVFQEPMTALNPVYTVGDQVAEVMRSHNVSRAEARQRTIELFRQVGIPDAEQRTKAYPHSLSGGMRQRIMIAMALANNPDLIILDEPTTALDATIQAQILELIRALAQEFTTSTILITHDFGVITEVSDTVIVMYGGKIMEKGTAAQVVSDPKHPYTRGLLESMPALGQKDRRLSVIPGSVPDPLRMPPGCPFAPRCPHAMDVCSTMPTLRTLEDERQVFCWLYEPTLAEVAQRS